MFIVLLNTFYGSSLESASPRKIYGPFETEAEALNVEEKLNDLIQQDEYIDAIAQTFEIDGKSYPLTLKEMKKEIFDEEDLEEEVLDEL